METVAFYSYKGGVGRTLLVANTAQFLAMSGRKVVALDLDLEAPGLHQKLGSRDDLKRAAGGTLRGAVDELLGILVPEQGNPGLLDTAIDVPLPDDAKDGFLRLIPAGSAPSRAYWAALEKLNNTLRASPPGSGLPEAILELQARIEEAFAPDFLLIDSRTGITELGGLATSLLADRVVCLTTTAPESIDGTKVVADALCNAPRLKSQQPLRLDFLVTRVLDDMASSAVVSYLKEQFGNSVTTLPHDSGIASEERVISSKRASKFAKVGQTDYDQREGQQLFSATLAWIAESFPSHQKDAEQSRRRMERVHSAWQWLTRYHPPRGIGWGARPMAWPVEQLRERVRFKSRLADIVAYDSAAANAKPLMIVEYVENEDREKVANWWLNETGVCVVALLSKLYEPTDYYSKSKKDSKVAHRRDLSLPLPLDFDAFSDPTDHSTDAMLDAIRAGYPEYLDRIVSDWIHSDVGSKPKSGWNIVDGLASVDDIALARQVLNAVPDGLHRHNRGHLKPWLAVDGDLLLAELFAPLLWRLPPAAGIIQLRGADDTGRGQEGHPFAVAAVTLLARDILGLRYDPVATFRVEGLRILERATGNSEGSRGHGLLELHNVFRHLSISFEISSDLPPLAVREAVVNEDRRKTADIGHLLSEQIAEGSLVITGLLGDYRPHDAQVVLYSSAIEDCAKKLDLQARHVGSVTLIHETLHALMHLGRDLDGRMWPEFALPDARSPLFEPSWFHETLTQYFTYQHLLRLDDPALMHAFEVMSEKSAAPYRAWKRLRGLPIEDARNWFMSVRRGIGAAPLSVQMLLNAPPDTD